MWKYTGKQRPQFALEPGPNQESVWDYPRPPVLVPDERKVEIYARNGDLLASTTGSMRVLETASPPTFYIPAEDLSQKLTPLEGSSFCEWKGVASYFSYEGVRLAWRYDNPSDRFKAIDGAYSFYASLAECWVDGERVRAQEGDFYGGWITNEIVGPFKGESGTQGW